MKGGEEGSGPRKQMKRGLLQTRHGGGAGVKKEERLMGRKGTCPEGSVPGAVYTLLSLCCAPSHKGVGVCVCGRGLGGGGGAGFM